MSKFSTVMFASACILAIFSTGFLLVGIEMQHNANGLFTALKENNPDAHNFCEQVVIIKMDLDHNMTVEYAADIYMHCYTWKIQHDYFNHQLESFNRKAYQICNNEGNHILDCFINTCLINRIDQCKNTPIMRDDSFQIVLT